MRWCPVSGVEELVSIVRRHHERPFRDGRAVFVGSLDRFRALWAPAPTGFDPPTALARFTAIPIRHADGLADDQWQVRDHDGNLIAEGTL